MKKLVVILTVGVLTGSVFAMADKPAAAPADGKACAVKDAACCTKDGSCKAGACADCKKAGGACAACKTKAAAGKAACSTEKAAKDAGCTGGVCPLKK